MAVFAGGYSDDEERSRDVARRYGKEFVTLKGFRIPGEVLKRVPVELIFRYNIVPLEEMQDGQLAIAIADPSQLMMIDEIRLLLNRRIVTKVSSLRQINEVLNQTGESQRGGYG